MRNNSLCIALVWEEVCVCAALPWQTIPSQKWDISWTVLWSCTVLPLVNFFGSSYVLLKRPWWGQLIWPRPTALIININIYIYIYGKYIFVLRENISKNEMVSILIEMTGEWGFLFSFFFFLWNCFGFLFSNSLGFLHWNIKKMA